MDKLPPDLKQYVKEDNEQFDKEIQEWDILQARKAQQEKLALAAAAAAAAASSTSTSASPQPMSIESSPPDNAGQDHDWAENVIGVLILNISIEKMLLSAEIWGWRGSD